MRTQRSGIALVAFGTLIILGGVAAIGFGVTKFVRFSLPIATFEAPGSVSFEFDEPGYVTLWHDHIKSRKGSSVSHRPTLSSDYTYELLDPIHGASGITSRGRVTFNFGPMKRVAVGSFDVPRAGSFEIRVGGPEPRQFAVTRGNSLAGTTGLIGGMGFGGVCCLIGLLLVAAGISSGNKRKRKESTPNG